MTRVVDASVAVKWFVEEEGSVEAAALLARTDDLVAPDLLVAEVSNVAWKKARAGQITPEQAALLIRSTPSMVAELRPCVGLAPRALEIALALDQPVYDCFYLALAEDLEARMVSDDLRLLGRVRETRWARRVTALRRHTK
jgi:predicted nucleic acid-binding protein